MSNGQLELDLGHKTTGYSSEWDQYSRLDDLDMYQKSAKATAIYPRDYSIVYPAIGLAGEAGEVANKVKKLIRDNPDMTDDIKEKVKISRNFNDENIRLLAERIICTNSSGDIPDDIRERYDDLIIKRTHEIGPWGSLDKTILDTEKLIKNVSNKEELNILQATKKKLDSMK